MKIKRGHFSQAMNLADNGMLFNKMKCDSVIERKVEGIRRDVTPEDWYVGIIFHSYYTAIYTNDTKI